MRTVVIFVGLFMMVSSCAVHEVSKAQTLDDVTDDSPSLTPQVDTNPKRVYRVASESSSTDSIPEPQLTQNYEDPEFPQAPINRKSSVVRAAPKVSFAAIPPADSFDPSLSFVLNPRAAPVAPKRSFAPIFRAAPFDPRVSFAAIPAVAPGSPKVSFAAIPPADPVGPKEPVSAILPTVPAISIASIASKYNVQERREPQWAILRSNVDNNYDGNFKYDFETENGIVVNAEGTLRQLGPEEIGQAIQGSYSYTAPDGTPIVTTYIADENGFQVQGEHLPVAPAEPELPPLIAKSVAYILSHPPLPENQQ